MWGWRSDPDFWDAFQLPPAGVRITLIFCVGIERSCSVCEGGKCIPMTCDEFSERVSEYVEAEIGGGGRTAMERHAAECAQCAQLLKHTQALTERLARLPRVRPSAGFDFALRSRLLLELAEEGQWWRRLQDLLFPSMPRALLAGAAVALVILGIAAVLNETPTWQAPQGDSAQEGELYPQPHPTTPDGVAGALKLLSKEESYTISGKLYQAQPDTSKSPIYRSKPDRLSQDVRQMPVRF